MKVKVWARIGMTITVDINDPNDEIELADKVKAKIDQRIQMHEDLILDGNSYIPQDSAETLEEGIYLDNLIPACLDGAIELYS